MSDDDRATTASDTMRGRSDESRVRLWLLLRMNRFALTAVLAVGVFATFMVVAVVVAPFLGVDLRDSNSATWLFSAMIGAVVTGTTLVVTISQLVLTQESGPLGDQHERMIGTMDFRTYTADMHDGVVPIDPSKMLRELVDETSRRAEAVQRLVAENDDDQLRSEVSEFVEDLQDNASKVTDQLAEAPFGSFDVVNAALNYNYSLKIHQVEELKTTFSDSLDEDETLAFDDLKSALVMFGPAREHVKTLYFQWALIDLSKYILYAAIPAVTVAAGMLTLAGSEPFPGRFLNVPTITWVVGAAFTLTLVPFLLFIAYILRIVTVAKRTLAIGPLRLRDI